VDDMVRMKNPDWKCVFTYVQSFYRRFEMQPKEKPAEQQHHEEEKSDDKHDETATAAAAEPAATDEVAKTEW